jgi:hypothetical protein
VGSTYLLGKIEGKELEYTTSHHDASHKNKKKTKKQNTKKNSSLDNVCVSARQKQKKKYSVIESQ